MSIGLPDTKLLWGRAGGICSICKIKLSEDKKSSNEAFPFGEQAHIVAEEPAGPRGKSPLSLEERNSYHNLILLCPTCHTKIDKAPDEYPVEILHQLKSKHECWFEKSRVAVADTRSQVNENIYAEIVEAAAKLCMFEEWSMWTSCAANSNPVWRSEWFDKIDQFRRRVLQVPWPGSNQELERALKTLSLNLSWLADVFSQHAELKPDGWVKGEKFYKTIGWNPVEYHRLLADYRSWMKLQAELISMATKAANWVADVVRRDLNPVFFAVPGHFVVDGGVAMDGSFFDQIEKFSDEEKLGEPTASLEKMQKAKDVEKARLEEELERSRQEFSIDDVWKDEHGPPPNSPK